MRNAQTAAELVHKSLAVAALLAACALLALETAATGILSRQIDVSRRIQLSVDTPVPADCRNGWELFRALAKGSIEYIRVWSDLEVYDADWSTFQNPVVIRRNLTIEGTNQDRPEWFVINMNFVRAKVTRQSVQMYMITLRAFALESSETYGRPTR
jgi:hypothetical protein